MRAMTEKPLFTARYRVHWSETDAAGRMHFSNFFRVLERCEEDLLASLGLIDRVIGHGIPPIAFPPGSMPSAAVLLLHYGSQTPSASR